MGLTALDRVEDRARQWLGRVEHTVIPPLRRQDLQTWAAVTHDRPLAARLEDADQPAEVSAMYLVGQLQPGPWPWHDELRADGLAQRDSPGARADDPVAVLHGGGKVMLHAMLREGDAHHARREVVAVERKGRPGNACLRVTVVTAYRTDRGVPVADYEEHILLREAPS